MAEKVNKQKNVNTTKKDWLTPVTITVNSGFI